MTRENQTAAKRTYRKRQRAALEAETRQRITEAAVELHGTVGPARTTIRAVAERAGVQRATVYRHFPAEEALFDACSAHWLARHPLPDVAGWAAIEDADQRLRTALRDLYAWYERGDSMVERTTRDVALVPALRPAMDEFAGWLRAAADILALGRSARGARRRRVRGAIGHALAFETWRSLVRGQGLSIREATALMEGLVAVAGQDGAGPVSGTGTPGPPAAAR